MLMHQRSRGPRQTCWMWQLQEQLVHSCPHQHQQQEMWTCTMQSSLQVRCQETPSCSLCRNLRHYVGHLGNMGSSSTTTATSTTSSSSSRMVDSHSSQMAAGVANSPPSQQMVGLLSGPPAVVCLRLWSLWHIRCLRKQGLTCSWVTLSSYACPSGRHTGNASLPQVTPQMRRPWSGCGSTTMSPQCPMVRTVMRSQTPLQLQQCPRSPAMASVPAAVSSHSRSQFYAAPAVATSPQQTSRSAHRQHLASSLSRSLAMLGLAWQHNRLLHLCLCLSKSATLHGRGPLAAAAARCRPLEPMPCAPSMPLLSMSTD